MNKDRLISQLIIFLCCLICITLVDAYADTNQQKNSSPAKLQHTKKQPIDKNSLIAQSVQSKLSTDKELKKFSLSVEGHQGLIEVNGTVDNEHQKQRAIEIAQHVHGVRSVTDGVVVKDKK